MEELAIKQSRQLIPMTPSMPKALVLNPSEKPKLKLGHQHQISSSHPTNQSPRSGSVTSSVGKLHVLKPVRERSGVSPTAKDSSSPTSVSRVASSPVAVAPSVVGSAPLRLPSNNPNLASVERKPALSILEKKPTPQSQSRNDFFNLVRKKSMTNPSSPLTSPGLAGSSSVPDKPGEAENGSVPNMSGDRDSPLSDSSFGDRTTEKSNNVKSNGIASNKARESLNGEHQEHLNNGKDHSICNVVLRSEEEEAAFLRSLGWEENAGDDGGLTEDEINSYYKEVDEYIKLRPSSKLLQGMQPKFLASLNLRKGSAGAGVSSESLSSDTKLES
ncbi:uncharacterized protein LOC130779731 [Actinidia eriantha]|uniref:uncharacterized protein LOC130779731 n=1 Tax=Actinidia eriantha TaxID=165200 RepID=UPI002585A41F|nr:uncharacterized protein LOC130779731 [Actinidia eriantha]XP_057494492.1 uncharacterized protein LOC130779731 [Actinidia eriantha]